MTKLAKEQCVFIQSVFMRNSGLFVESLRRILCNHTVLHPSMYDWKHYIEAQKMMDDILRNRTFFSRPEDFYERHKGFEFVRFDSIDSRLFDQFNKSIRLAELQLATLELEHSIFERDLYLFGDRLRDPAHQFRCAAEECDKLISTYIPYNGVLSTVQSIDELIKLIDDI